MLICSVRWRIQARIERSKQFNKQMPSYIEHVVGLHKYRLAMWAYSFTNLLTIGIFDAIPNAWRVIMKQVQSYQHTYPPLHRDSVYINTNEIEIDLLTVTLKFCTRNLEKNIPLIKER